MKFLKKVSNFESSFENFEFLNKSVMVDELNTNLYLDPGIEMSLDEYPYIFGILLIAVQ